MEGLQLCLFLFTFLASVIQCKALCYRYDTWGRYCVRYSSYYYYYYSTYWSSTRIIGSAAGGGISLIVCIVVIVCFCRYCNRRQAYAGSTIVNNQSVSTVTTSQQQQQGFSAPYYPQQPGYQPQYTYPTYPAGQTTYPAGQPTYPTGQPTYPTSQPPQQTPMVGYSNTAFSPPSYEQAAYQTKPNEQPTAPMQ